MRQNFLSKRFPTIIALLLLFTGIWAGSYVLKRGIMPFGGASESAAPEKVTISNITDTSFTVSYGTEQKTSGAVSFGSDRNLGTIASDDRDRKSNSQSLFYSHSITVSNLKPSTTYSFSIVSDGNTYLDNGNRYSVITGKSMQTAPPNQNAMRGRIIMPDGAAAADTLVYLLVNNGQKISTVTDDEGNYTFSFTGIRTADLQNYLSVPAGSAIEIQASTQNVNSDIRAAYQPDGTIPVVTLSQTYVFTPRENASNSAFMETSATQSSELTASIPASSSGKIQILTPSKNQGIPDQRPSFTGTAVPGAKITITIHSQIPIVTQVTADSSGYWQYTPSTALSPGEHTITIETADADGILKLLTQTFTVYAQGSQVSDSATPSSQLTNGTSGGVPSSTQNSSATPAPTLIALADTPTPTLTPTATPAPLPTQPVLTPTLPVTPTVTPSTSLTQTTTFSTGTATSITSSASSQTIPPTGTETPVTLIIGAAVLCISIGVFLIFLI